MTSSDAGVMPDPTGGWSTEIVTLRDAMVVPPDVSQMRQPAGVLHADGTCCAHAATWRGAKPITLPPPCPEGPLPVIQGRWLWGGLLWAHFGHFLAESTARLWAIDHLERPVDGVLFIPKRPRLGDQVQGYHRSFIDLLGADLPLRVAAAPSVVEELVVPGQGFGLGPISAGTEGFRNTFHRRFGAGIEPEGPEKLYISRSMLGLRKGGLLGESFFEERLAEQGYEIFHPQKHDMATQIARYKAARKVIAADGSALHLYAMVGTAEQDVAVVLRRTSSVANNLITHMSHFCGREPHVLNVLRREWVPKRKQRSSRLSFGELHLPRLQRRLVRRGFIEQREPWPALSEEDRNAIFEAKGLTGRRAYIAGADLSEPKRKSASPQAVE